MESAGHGASADGRVGACYQLSWRRGAGEGGEFITCPARWCRILHDRVKASLVDKEMSKIETQVVQTQERLDRYFQAFEAGTMKPELCNEKVEALSGLLADLEAEKRALEARKQRLELPAVDRDMLSSLMDNFEVAMAEAPNPQKKHPLQRLVKKVLVHDRQTVEVWYRLPHPQLIEYWDNWLPESNPLHNHRTPVA